MSQGPETGPDYGPVRKIRQTATSLTGSIPSPKSDIPLRFESSVERDGYALWSMDPAVEKIWAQPVRVPWTDDTGKERLYTPDALVRYTDGSFVLYEIKSQKDLERNGRTYAPKFRAGRLYAQKKGWRYKVLTDADIRGPALDLAIRLLPLMRETPDGSLAARLLRILRERGYSNPGKGLSIGALVSKALEQDGEKGALLRTAWVLLAQGILETNRENPNPAAPHVWLVETSA